MISSMIFSLLVERELAQYELQKDIFYFYSYKVIIYIVWPKLIENK